MDKEKSNKNRLGIVLAIVVLLLIIVIIVLVVVLLKKNNELSTVSDATSQNQTNNASGDGQPQVLAYETGVVATDPVTLQQLYDEMVARAEEGTMALEMQTEASSTDGTEFNCYIANAYNNNYDMFVIIYLDETGEEIYRSGLIPLGSRIETFTSNRKLDPGNYVATIVYTQVEDDRATIHSQVNVGLNLIVR